MFFLLYSLKFFEKNQKGYCWRDNKYYSEEELKSKAMISLAERMLTLIELYRKGKVIDPLQQEVIGNTSYFCKVKEFNCGVFFIPKNYSEKYLVELYNKNK